MTRSQKGKTLNITNINKQEKMLEDQLEAQVLSSTTGDYFTLKIDKKLRKTKIMKMISEIMAQFQYARTKKIKIEDAFVPYSIFMLIKHFTSFGANIPNELEKQLKIMNKLIDLDLLEPILELFPEEEVEEIYEAINETMRNTDKQVKELASRMEEIERAYEDGNIEELLRLNKDDTLEIIDEN